MGVCLGDIRKKPIRYPQVWGCFGGIPVAAEHVAVMDPLYPAHDRLRFLTERRIECAKEHARRGEDAEGKDDGEAETRWHVFVSALRGRETRKMNGAPMRDLGAPTKPPACCR